MICELYAIREKQSGLYLYNRRDYFGQFDHAIYSGVFFNQKESAEKRIKEMMKNYSDMDRVRAVYTRYRLFEDWFTTNPDHPDIEGSNYGLKYRPIGIEVVPIFITPTHPA